ncbi:MAG: hypothetical protein K2N14_04345, partial [Clostridia bacterium]|nr:hypothetical protein [Clostridia bacterium]
MKKFLLILLTLILSISIAGCATGLGNGDGNTGGKPVTPVVPDNPVTPPDEVDTNPFTVTLWDVEYDEPLAIYEEDGTTALWTSKDDGSVTEVEFSEEGVAKTEGLDGDYIVTINNLPEDYVYNPNIYSATNDARDVKVLVYTISKTTGPGTGWYDKVLKLPKAGAIYRVRVNSASQKVYCMYTPPATGEYYIETWADITANEINPRIDLHDANHSFVNDRVALSLNYTDDAPCSVFTKNFKYRISAYSGVFAIAFELMCDSRVGYPVDVDICVARAGDYDFGEEPTYEMYMPKEEFKEMPNYNSWFKPLFEDDPNGVLRGERVGFNSEDGYYHILDANGAMTDKVLYAIIDGGIDAPSGGTIVNFQSTSTTDPDTG